jgi:hypothetical protein
VWEPAPSGGGGISQAEADARYLRLTGGEVVVAAADSIYNQETFLEVDDGGLAFGVRAPQPNEELTAISFVPRVAAGEDGAILALVSPYPVDMQAPNGTDPTNLVNKGYVDAKTSGHCRGTLSGTAPGATATKLTLAKQVGSADVTISGTTATVSKAGYWAISATINGSQAVTQGSRAFVSILTVGTPDSVMSRASIGPGESWVGISTVVYLEAGARIAIDYYNAAGGSTIASSFFYFKYLGAS